MVLAHSQNWRGDGHLLRDHLRQTAEKAKEFARHFDAGDLAYWAGLWHDLGKVSPEFQEYISRRSDSRGPDHATAGALFASCQGLLPLSLLIAGHHGGLPAWVDMTDRIKRADRDPRFHAFKGQATALKDLGLDLIPRSPPLFPQFVREAEKQGDVPTQELFLRMLFSSLTDADFLDTERHFSPEREWLRHQAPNLSVLAERFFHEQNRFSGKGRGLVNRIRHQVYQKAQEAASKDPGFFRLVAPTGCGKTRSSLAFALAHALAHGMRRVIVAIPYTSIVEQTAWVYRSVLGEEAVLEHHSAVGWDEEESDGQSTPSRNEYRARLASENWDWPLIVTTTVQLLESLFAHRPGKCRKLHNLARSVVIIDEVQMLPLRLLGPILDVLKDLVEHYGVTVLLCSATLPDYSHPVFQERLPSIHEVIPDPRPLFQELRRVRYLYCEKTWEQVARAMRQAPQCLAVVNTRRDALALLSALDDPQALHLSTLLCGAHRRDVLQEVRRRLREGLPCRLVATQVVEAGVDLDFPLVFRAVGPLDRIVQSAGRCNREGRTKMGEVVIFNPAEGGLPDQEYERGTILAKAFLERGLDPEDPSTMQEYFTHMASGVEQDWGAVQGARVALDYPEVARKFRLIEDDTVPVLVPYPDRATQEELARELEDQAVNLRQVSRRLQPYLVNIRRRQIADLERQGLVRQAIPGHWVWLGAYDIVRGIGPALADPEQFVV